MVHRLNPITTLSNVADSRSMDSAVASTKEILELKFEALDFAIATELSAGSTPTISDTFTKLYKSKFNPDPIPISKTLP